MEREKLIETVTRAKAGDAEAVEALFSAFYNDVYYFACKTVKDPDIACDITQESFLEVINTLDKLQEPAAFKAWLRQITYHQCTRYFKKTKEVQVEEDEDGNSIFDTLADESEGSLPAEVYEKAEFRQTILDMIDSLSPEQRSAVMLYYFDELSVEEVAKIQGVSTGTVKSRLNYARKSLKASVEGYEKKHGIKLHSIAPLPLLAYILRAAVSEMPQSAVVSSKAAISAAASGAVAAGAAAGGAATGVAAGLGVKIGAGIAAAVLAVTGVAVALGGDPEPGSYASENMHIYRESHLVAEGAEQVLGSVPAYIVTEDGQVYELLEKGEPVLKLEDAQMTQTALIKDSVGYTDDDGAFHICYSGKDMTFAGVRGQVQCMFSPFSDYRYALSVDEAGAWASAIHLETGEPLLTNKPLQVAGDQVTLESAQIKGMQTVPGILGKFCLRTEDGFLYGTPFMITDEDDHVRLQLADGVTARGRVLDYEYGINNYMPLYLDEAALLQWRGNTVQLPRGYTGEDLLYAKAGPQLVLVFEDGNIYRMESDWEAPQLHEELSALNRDGHVREVFVDSYHYSSNILAWMDDGTLYTVMDT